MGSYNEVDSEFKNRRQINSNQKLGMSDEEILKNMRRHFLKLLSDYTKRNVIVYYSTWVQSTNHLNPNPELLINDNDMNGFMNAICGLDKSKGLDLILQTPGGGTTATEAIVNYLRKCFNNDIRIIVPHMAMSAGTMIACSAKEIIMGKESSLGPIDPQLMGLPCEGVISEFNKAIDECSKNPNKSIVWREIISQYRPTYVGECKYAITLSKTLLKNWLSTCMFKDNKNKKAIVNNIVKFLSHNASKQHDRHYDFNACNDVGLKVIALESDQVLQDYVLSIHHSYVLTSYICSNYVKMIETSEGKGFILCGPR